MLSPHHSALSHKVKASYQVNHHCRNPMNPQNVSEYPTMLYVRYILEMDTFRVALIDIYIDVPQECIMVGSAQLLTSLA